MSMLRYICVALLAFAFALAMPDTSHAQFGKLKDKIKKKGEEKVEKKVDEALEGEKSEDTATEAAEEPAEEAAETPATAAAAPAGEEFQLYTKFDFVPGQKVLFYDDLSGEEMAEFPSRWKLNEGVFEIAKVGQDTWIMSSTRGEIVPKLNVTQLPEKYTVEFDYLNRTADYQGSHFIKFAWLNAEGRAVARLEVWNNSNAYFYMYDDEGHDQRISDISLPESYAKGIHHYRFMVTKSTVKCYVDNHRVANAPRTAGFQPATFAIGFHGNDNDFEKEKMFIRNFRFAEGGKTMREQLDESGRVVTHGIYFDVNSDKIKGESYKTLADIGQMLKDDPALSLTIEGHTDSDGEDAFNEDLSQRRAEAVKKYLIDTYSIDASRLEAKGLGESKPVDANTTPEGKANNRRVELVKV